jgi:hypothetical protein
MTVLIGQLALPNISFLLNSMVRFPKRKLRLILL